MSEVQVLGRVGTNLKAGLVGLPNVGKSTFFNVLCKQNVAAENCKFSFLIIIKFRSILYH